MCITSEQMNQYKEQGYLFLPSYFHNVEVDILKSQLPTVYADQTKRRINEKNGAVLRSVYGSHETNDVFRRLTRHPRIVDPARRLLDSEVYVYQFKVNAKVAFGGDLWEWHQDYIFWRNEDGMPAPRVINVAIFLDEVNEFNGPMFLLPGSHKEGMIQVGMANASEAKAPAKSSGKSPSWIGNLTAKLKYSLDQETLARLSTRYGMVAPKGPAGSVLLFDSNIVHGSPHNISPFDRAVLIVTYNSIENKPVPGKKRRPDFLASRRCEPVVPLHDHVLVQ